MQPLQETAPGGSCTPRTSGSRAHRAMAGALPTLDKTMALVLVALDCGGLLEPRLAQGTWLRTPANPGRNAARPVRICALRRNVLCPTLAMDFILEATDK